jgi:hypothetical protein
MRLRIITPSTARVLRSPTLCFQACSCGKISPSPSPVPNTTVECSTSIAQACTILGTVLRTRSLASVMRYRKFNNAIAARVAVFTYPPRIAQSCKLARSPSSPSHTLTFCSVRSAGAALHLKSYVPNAQHFIKVHCFERIDMQQSTETVR